MVFRRLHRTAGPPLLLAFIGVIAAVVVPLFIRTKEPLPLPFLGFTNHTGRACALFQLRENTSGFLNLTTRERRHAVLVADTTDGPVTNPVAVAHATLDNGSSALALPVPTNATAITVMFQQNVRKGRVRIPQNGPPINLFQLPWSRTEVFRSERIAVTNLFQNR